MENAQMKIIASVLLRLWMITGMAMILFFIAAPADYLGITFCEVTACYGIVGFFVKRLGAKYGTERNTGKASKMVGVILVLLIVIKGIMIL